MAKDKKPRRDKAVLLHTEQQLLADWAKDAVELFNGEMCYQVGSTIERKPNFRDVDIRVMLETKDFNRLRKIVNIDRLNLAVSLWGQKVTGMPIDFQVQDVTYANEHHRGLRGAVGMGSIYKGDGYAKD